jgi:hypothetical protein
MMQKNTISIFWITNCTSLFHLASCLQLLPVPVYHQLDIILNHREKGELNVTVIEGNQYLQAPGLDKEENRPGSVTGGGP